MTKTIEFFAYAVSALIIAAAMLTLTPAAQANGLRAVQPQILTVGTKTTKTTIKTTIDQWNRAEIR